MGSCSSKPKTTEFEGSMNFYIQEELARKNLDGVQKGGCNVGLKSIDPEQKISSKCSLRPTMEVVDMSKEQVIAYERHSPAFQPPQTFEELHGTEPPRSIYGKDMASEIDELLEKLASEFERQESLSSFSP